MMNSIKIAGLLLCCVLGLVCLGHYLQQNKLGAYGYSVWYVPEPRLSNWPYSHVPHVTLTTEYASASKALADVQEYPDSVTIVPETTPKWFESSDDPLPGYGLKVTVDQIKTWPGDTPPHLTLLYKDSDKDTQTPEITFAVPTFEAQKCVADTRSYDPSEWYVIGCSQ